MVGQKLVNILQSLDAEEFKRLKRALSSPYFATNSRLLVLYDYLKKLYPSFEEDQLHKELLFKKLYPGKPINEGVLRVLVREFTTVVEEFIMFERLRSDKTQRKKMLVKEYGHRNLYDYFKKGMEELHAEIDGDFVKDMEYFSNKIELHQEYCFHPMTNTYDAKDDSLEQLMDSLDAYFVLAKYRFVQILRNRNTIFKKKAEYRFFEMVRESEDDFFIENKLIVLYELINKLHSTNDEKIFLQLKEIFFPIIDKVRRTDCRIIYFMGLNFCSRQINMGNSGYFIEQFDWYKIGLQNDIVVENNKMSHSTFNNIINAAIYKKELKWAGRFMVDYYKFLDSSIREDALNYSKAILLIEEGDYQQALQLYTQNNYGINYQLKVRAGMIKAAFEQSLIDFNYFNVLQSYIESFKKYLQRNVVYSEVKVLQNLAFVKIVEKLSKKIKSNEDKIKIKEWLKKALIKEESIVLRSWLFEKTNLL